MNANSVSDSRSVSDFPSPPPPALLKPIRSELIITAVAFLKDPQVQAAPLSKRLAFLEGKGLTTEEIDLALSKSSNDSFSKSSSIPSQPAQSTQATQATNHTIRNLIVSTAVVIGAGSLLISNYKTIKEYSFKLFGWSKPGDDGDPESQTDNVEDLKNQVRDLKLQLKNILSDP